MDLVLRITDDLVFDKVWASLVPVAAFSQSLGNESDLFAPEMSAWFQLVSKLPHPPIDHHSLSDISAWPRTYIPRQLLSLTVITFIGSYLLYFLFAGISYYFIFNHDMMRHPKFLKNQVRHEIIASVKALPVMGLITLPFFQAEIMGYSRLYDGLNTYGYTYLVLSIPFFLLFTDYCIYWIHRWLHVPAIYKALHKPHHKWIIPTPFASHAFHPVDGFAQSFPYHLFILLFPMHRVTFLVMFVAVNVWAIFIHDSDMITGHSLEKIINGPAHHTLHHIYFTVNYGQYFTWADRAGGSYRQPEKELDPLLEIQMNDRKNQEVRETRKSK